MQGLRAIEFSDPAAALIAVVVVVTAMIALVFMQRAGRKSADPLQGLFSPARLAAEIEASERRLAQRGAPCTLRPRIDHEASRSEASVLARHLRRTIGAESVRPVSALDQAETGRRRYQSRAKLVTACDWEEVLLLPPPSPPPPSPPLPERGAAKAV